MKNLGQHCSVWVGVLAATLPALCSAATVTSVDSSNSPFFSGTVTIGVDDQVNVGTGGNYVVDGTVTNLGEIVVPFRLSNAGVVTVEPAGIINNQGTVDSQGGFNVSGEFNNLSGGNVSGAMRLLSGGAFTNAAADNQWGSSRMAVEAGSTFENQPGAGFTVGNLPAGSPFGGILDVFSSGNATNHGTFSTARGGALRVSGTFLNTGTFEGINAGSGGTLEAESGGVITNNGEINYTGGDIRINTGGVLKGTGDLLVTAGPVNTPVGVRADGSITQGTFEMEGGVLSGRGNVTATNGPVILGPDVEVQPGLSLGTLTIDDDVELDGDYVAEINEDPVFGAPKIGADKLVVNGTLTLGATADLIFEFAFDPTLGETFEILDVDELIGSFASVTIVPPQGEEGPSAEFQSFSFNTSVAEQGGRTVMSVTVVPEPASAVLLGLGGLAMLRRRR